MKRLGIELKIPTARDAILAVAFIVGCFAVTSALTVLVGAELKVTAFHLAFALGVIATAFGIQVTNVRNACFLAVISIAVYTVLYLLGF